MPHESIVEDRAMLARLGRENHHRWIDRMVARTYAFPERGLVEPGIGAWRRMTITSERTNREKRPVDLINAGSLLSDEEKRVRDLVREFVDREVIPTAADYWDRAQFPFELLPGLGELGLMGGTLPEEYGCAGWNNVAYGLAIAELARGSGSLATFLHVQSGLAMTAIHELGSEEQKQHWLPSMAKCEKIGCFGLTEPEAGSDPGSLKTTAVEKDGGYVLDGEKKWIGNASFSDVAVIWARTEEGKISGFLVETENPGFQAAVLPRKASQRAAWQTHIRLRDCHIPADARLPEATGLGSTLALRRGVGRPRAGRRLLRDGAGLREGEGAVRATHSLLPARPAEARRDGERDLTEPAALHPRRTLQGRRRARPCDGLDVQDEQRHQGAPHRGHRARCPRGQRHPPRLPRDGAHGRYRGRLHLRGHERHKHPHSRTGHNRPPRLLPRTPATRRRKRYEDLLQQ